MSTSLKVAVIGCGAGGLITAHELQNSGHHVTIFEKSAKVGGLWVYDPRTESDPLGIDPTRDIVHGSLYSSLRTNLPRHLMGFPEYPLTRTFSDSRTFPAHEEVLEFLTEFARSFRLTELTRFNTEVVRVEMRGDEWVVESRNGELSREESFEAVVVCNGNQTQPRVAEFPGWKKWPGKQIHSHNYRVPEPFQNKIVLIIGAGPSAWDIFGEIAAVAKETHISIRTHPHFINLSNFGIVKNKHSKIAYADASGKVAFEDGSSVYPDIILHCTGYKYDFPFLKTNGIITVDDNRVGPLYKHVFSPEIGPSLSFVGLPSAVLGMPEMGFQAKWISLILSGHLHLPSKELMMADIEQHYRSMEENGIPKHHTHNLFFKFDYMDWLAAQTGVPPMDERLKKMFKQLFMILSGPQGSRFKEWDFDSLLKSIS